MDLRLVGFMIQGSESEASIVPVNADTSLLLERITSGEMPPGETNVAPEKTEVVRRAGGPLAGHEALLSGRS